MAKFDKNLLFSAKRASILTHNMTQPLEELRRPGREPNVGLVPLTPGQERFAALMTSDPPAAFPLLKRKYDAMSADPERPSVRSTRIGNTPVEIDVDLGHEKITLRIPIDKDHLDIIMRLSEEEGLSESFMNDLKGGLIGEGFRLGIEFSSRYGLHILHLLQSEWRYVELQREKASPEVAAVLFDLLEPQGIETPAQEEGEPVVLVRRPAQEDRSRLVGLFDQLLERSAGSAPAAPQTDRETQAGPAGGEAAPSPAKQLADLIRTDTKEAFIQIKEKVAAAGGGEARALQRPRLANVGSTNVEIGLNERSLTLSLEIDYRNLQHFMGNCGENGLSKVFKAALDRGISGSHRLQIKAELADSAVTIKATSTRWNGLEQVNDKSGEVSPEVFAELVGMLKPFDKSSTVRPRISSHRDDEGKRGHKFRPLNLTEISRRHK